MIPVLQEKFRNSKIIALHVESGFPEKDVPTLHKPDEVQKFLEKELQDIDPSVIRIIEWRPSMNYYRARYVKLLSLTVEFIKRIDAEKRTVAAFGKRWFRNFFKNLNLLNRTLLYKPADIPVIVTGSGPGLETAMPLIQKIQNNCIIIAASSSLMALNKNGISADMAIATDGGCWALQHIYPMFRNSCGGSLAVNLCAALPSQCAGIPFLVLNDGSFWQSVILHELKLPSVIIPQRGTVTASAVELALVLTSGNIFLAGTDLSVRDIKTHVRPYGFDYLFFGSADRFSPVYSKYFLRSGLMRDGGSMDVYAAWFKNQLALWPKRIFSLGGSNAVFENALPSEQKDEGYNTAGQALHPPPTAAFRSKRVPKVRRGIKPFDSSLAQPGLSKHVHGLAPFGNKKKSEYFNVVKVNEESAQFCKRGINTLLSSLKNSEYAQNIKAELVSLLLPGKKEVTESELEAAITGALDG